MALKTDPRNAHRQNDDWMRARGVLIDLDEAKANAQSEAEHCPYCEQLVHPDNWRAHMEQRHEEEWDGSLPGQKRRSKDTLAMSAIRVDGGTQPRALIDEETVRDYAQAMRDGAEFPPVVVFYDGGTYWLADGYHRLAATKEAGRSVVRVEIHQGTQRDAILYSVGANATHGLRRTNADKRRAVERLLRDEEWSKWSDREIARQCQVSAPFVAKLRSNVTVNVYSEPRTYTTKHGTPATMNTTNIGVKPALPESAPIYLRDAVDLGLVGAQQAVTVAKVLERAPEPVVEVAANHGVTDVDTIQILNRLHKNGSESFDDIAMTGHVQPGDEGEAVPVTAGALKVQKALDERARIHKQLSAEERRAAHEFAPADWQPEWNILTADITGGLLEIADESVDVIVTDPPYGAEYLPLYGTLARLAARILKPNGSLLALAGQSYLPNVMTELGGALTYHWTHAYLTPGGQSAQLWQRKVNTFWKPVLHFVKGEYQGDWMGDVVRSEPNDNDKRLHEWQQSESGMADLVTRFTYPKQLICDPFCGSGTTGVVAVRLNRNFIGADVNAGYVAIAAERLTKLCSAK